METLPEYASLIAHGRPDFIEIKGVTFCGTSSASTLTISNSPFHADVVAFALDLADRINKLLGTNEYELATAHAHSCCVCVASTRYKVDGTWHTWINYERFHELWARWSETGEPFDKAEYIAPTPAWAVHGAKEEGFNPTMTRVRKKGAYSKAKQLAAQGVAPA